MAGHSKWSNIQHRKKAQDAKRGKVFTKIIREITVSARLGGPRLDLAVDKAKKVNMSKDTINRAIEKGQGGGADSQLDDILYEGYGPSGIALMVSCLTDNKNRTVAEVRHAFSKCGGNLGTDGSVSYLFDWVGLLSFPAGSDANHIMEVALEAGATDVIVNDDTSVDVTTEPGDLLPVTATMEAQGLTPDSDEVTYLPKTYIDVDDQETAEQLIRLNDMLDNLDDVQHVYSNANIDDAVLESLS